MKKKHGKTKVQYRNVGNLTSYIHVNYKINVLKKTHTLKCVHICIDYK